MPIPLHAALIALGAVFAYVTMAWLLSLALRDSGIMDVFWGPGFLVATGTVAWLEFGYSGRQWLVLAMVALWAVRLSLHIGLRNAGQPEDARYAKWRAERPASWWWFSWFKVFALQGVILWVVAAPLMAAVSSPEPAHLTLWDWAGAIVWVIGLLFETIADAQLAAFKRRGGEGVYDRGLWAWSRHPNYFGESVLWIGFALIGLAVPGGAWTLIGPALMIWLIIRVSGVRMLDNHLSDAKPGYQAYIAKTSAFIPWPPKSA